MKVNDTLVSVILSAEDSEDQHILSAVDNIFEQTHKNIDLVITLHRDVPSELREKVSAKSMNVQWIKVGSDKGILDIPLEHAKGEFIFYKTVMNVLWYERHIAAHLEEFAKNSNISYMLSHLEYRNIDLPDHPLNVMGFRVAVPPRPQTIIIDEIAHRASAAPVWADCWSEGEDGASMVVAEATAQWNNQGLRGGIPAEITVIEWMKAHRGGEEGVEGGSKEEVMAKLGAPSRTDVKDETTMSEDGDIEIVRDFPTIVGNISFMDYNNSILGQVPSDITSIAIKRSIGMGDVILVEPIIKKLKQKYPKVEITLYTASDRIANYFEHKPDKIEKIPADLLLKDFLADKPQQVKFDLDLAYESRLGKSFIDSYAEVCGIEFDDAEDKHVQLTTNIGELTIVKPELPKGEYVVVCGDGSGWPGKTWGVQNYTEVIKWLKEKGYEVVETGTEVSTETDPKYHGCDLDTMVRLLAGCVLYIGGDNGPMHIARGFSTPCLTIAGAALPYFTNPNRKEIFYVQHNTHPGLGIKHQQFVNMNGSQLTFMPNYEPDPPCGIDKIKPKDVIGCLEKMFHKPMSLIDPQNEMDFLFNIPGWCYYVDPKTGYIQRSDPEKHPDQDKDISEEYSGRWKEVYDEYSVTFVEEVSKQHPTGKLIDVGCNMGLVVKAAVEAGYDATGIDMNELSIAKGKEVFPEIADRLTVASELVGGKYDIITLNQVLEHITDTHAFLNTLLTNLAKGGSLYIGIPNFGSKAGQLDYQGWQTMGVGEHVSQFTEESFKHLMEIVGANYELLQDAEEGIFARLWL